MKTLRAVWAGTLLLLATGIALAQTGNATNTNDGMWTGWTSGYGGIGVTILIAIVVAGIVTLVMKRAGK